MPQLENPVRTLITATRVAGSDPAKNSHANKTIHPAIHKPIHNFLRHYTKNLSCAKVNKPDIQSSTQKNCNALITSTVRIVSQ